MNYIFNFRYVRGTELDILNNFIKSHKMKWNKRLVGLNGEVVSQFIYDGDFDCTILNDFQQVKSSGINIDSIEKDNGVFIESMQFVINV